MAVRPGRPVPPGAEALNRLAAATARYNCKCGKWIVLPPNVKGEADALVCECGEKHYWTPYPEHLCKLGRERIEQLGAALHQAMVDAREWHDMGMPEEDRERTWASYYRGSPELSLVRKVLGDDPEAALQVPAVADGQETDPDDAGESLREQRRQAIGGLLAVCEDYVALFCDSDMTPEDDCHVFYERCKAAVAKWRAAQDAEENEK